MNFLEESRGEIDHTLSLTPSTLLEGEASPVGEFLVDSTYPVHLFDHPDFVSYYREQDVYKRQLLCFSGRFILVDS